MSRLFTQELPRMAVLRSALKVIPNLGNTGEGVAESVDLLKQRRKKIDLSIETKQLDAVAYANRLSSIMDAEYPRSVGGLKLVCGLLQLPFIQNIEKMLEVWSKDSEQRVLDYPRFACYYDAYKGLERPKNSFLKAIDSVRNGVDQTILKGFQAAKDTTDAHIDLADRLSSKHELRVRLESLYSDVYIRETARLEAMKRNLMWDPTGVKLLQLDHPTDESFVLHEAYRVGVNAYRKHYLRFV